jgi:hypothetical protein
LAGSPGKLTHDRPQGPSANSAVQTKVDLVGERGDGNDSKLNSNKRRISFPLLYKNGREKSIGLWRKISGNQNFYKASKW